MIFKNSCIIFSLDESFTGIDWAIVVEKGEQYTKEEIIDRMDRKTDELYLYPVIDARPLRVSEQLQHISGTIQARGINNLSGVISI